MLPLSLSLSLKHTHTHTHTLTHTLTHTVSHKVSHGGDGINVHMCSKVEAVGKGVGVAKQEFHIYTCTL